jgi:nitroreductase
LRDTLNSRYLLPNELAPHADLVISFFRGKSRQIQADARGLSPLRPCATGESQAQDAPIPMTDALELLKTRRSVKPIELVGPAPTPDEINTLLTIASRVPDHGKLVPWRFIVFEGDARLAAGDAIVAAFRRKYPQATAEQIAIERNRLARAPLVIAVVSRAAPHVKIPEWEQVLSAGAAAMNLLTAAHALGYGASWMTEWYAYNRAVLDELGLQANERIVGFVHIGRQKGPVADRPRPDLALVAARFSGN